MAALADARDRCHLGVSYVHTHTHTLWESPSGATGLTTPPHLSSSTFRFTPACTPASQLPIFFAALTRLVSGQVVNSVL